MEGGNSGQNKQNNDQQKAGLSWTQPPASSALDKGAQKAVEAAAADSTGSIIGIVVGVIVVFALAAWGIVALNKRSAPAVATNDTPKETPAPAPTPAAPAATPAPTPAAVAPTPTPTPVAAGSAAFTIATQDAGSAVAVTGVSLTEPTWIIVYESRDGSPGNILGAGLFFKGDTSGIVSLLRATTSGKSYFASAAVDNGDKSFAKADEKYVADQSGGQMWIKFQTR